MLHVCVIEDEAKVSAFIKKGLTELGYMVACFNNAADGLQYLAAHENTNLVLLDVMLPGIDGVEACRLIKSTYPGVRVIMLTALDAVHDKLRGFKAGADDYLPKPFHFDELTARIEAVCRRTVQEDDKGTKLRFADLELDTGTKTAARGGRQITLTAKEYALLLLFMQHAKKLLSREYIAEQVWGLNFDTGTNVIDVYVNYLRKKITTGNESRLIHTVIGMGYILKA